MARYGFSERTYHYSNLHMWRHPEGGQFEVDQFEQQDGSTTDTALPMLCIELDVSDEVLMVGACERVYDRYDDSEGRAANYGLRLTPIGLLSVDFDAGTGRNRFQRMELLRADPRLITPRALGSLSIIRANQDEITRVNVPALTSLLRETVQS